MDRDKAGRGPVVLTDQQEHVLVITINRPEVRNAINAEVSTLIGRALEWADGAPGIRCVVLTGAGGLSFSAGADLGAVARNESLMAGGHEDWGFAGLVTNPISKPLIAAVRGSCLGGGTEIVLACDLVVASETAVFGLPEVTRGIMAGAGGVIRLPQQLPAKIAMHVILTGEPLSAQTAHRWGLINAVVPDDQVVSAALDLAKKVARSAPLAVQASKRVARGIDRSGSIAGEEQAWRHNDQEFGPVFASTDAAEGVAAFHEKRSPVWIGR